MKIFDVLREALFFTYEAMVRVTFVDESADVVSDLIRALPGVTTVTNAGVNQELHIATLKVKLLSQKTGIEAFRAFKHNAINKYNVIKKVEVAAPTIQRIE